MSRKNSSTDGRTTRRVLVNVVRGRNLVFHAEYDLKSEKSAKAFHALLTSQLVDWGNFPKPPKLSKDGYTVKIDDSTFVYITVLLERKQQCELCGTWSPGKADYCPLCQGKVQSSSSIKLDL